MADQIQYMGKSIGTVHTYIDAKDDNKTKYNVIIKGGHEGLTKLCSIPHGHTIKLGNVSMTCKEFKEKFFGKDDLFITKRI